MKGTNRLEVTVTLLNDALLDELGRFVKRDPSPMNLPVVVCMSPLTSIENADKVEVAMVDVVMLEAIIVDAIILDV